MNAFLHRLIQLVNILSLVWSELQKETEIDDLDPWFFPLPSNMCIIKPGPNDDFMTTAYRAVLSSPVVYNLTLKANMFVGMINSSRNHYYSFADA